MPGPDVALVSLYPMPGSGDGISGVATYTANLARALHAAGASVTVMAQAEPGQKPEESDQGVRVQRCFARGRWALPVAARAAAVTGAAVVHVQHELFLYGGPASVPGLLPALGGLRRRRRGPVVTMHQVVAPASVDRRFTALHGVPVPAVLARTGIGGVQATIRQVAARTIVHERAFAQVVRGAVVLPHGVSQPSPARGHRGDGQARARRRLQVRGEGLVVLCFGFVSPYKGLEAALEAAARAGPAVEMVVAGGEHPRLAGQGYLPELARRWGSVARFTGYVPDDEVGAWFDAADLALLVYPQPFSASGVLALALQHSTPLLVSESLAACIEAPDLGVPTDAASLAARLADLAGDAGALRRLGRASEALGVGRTWADVARRHLDIYQEVIDANGAAGRRGRPR